MLGAHAVQSVSLARGLERARVWKFDRRPFVGIPPDFFSSRIMLSAWVMKGLQSSKKEEDTGVTVPVTLLSLGQQCCSQGSHRVFTIGPQGQFPTGLARETQTQGGLSTAQHEEEGPRATIGVGVLGARRPGLLVAASPLGLGGATSRHPGTRRKPEAGGRGRPQTVAVLSHTFSLAVKGSRRRPTRRARRRRALINGAQGGRRPTKGARQNQYLS